MTQFSYTSFAINMFLGHAVSTQERLVLKKYYFDPYFCGYYTREVNKQERLMMARVRYVMYVSSLEYVYQFFRAAVSNED